VGGNRSFIEPTRYIAAARGAKPNDALEPHLVADNAQTRARLEWQPRYTTCDSFYEMFKALGTAR
jgi:hypothetical protein